MEVAAAGGRRACLAHPNAARDAFTRGCCLGGAADEESRTIDPQKPERDDEELIEYFAALERNRLSYERVDFDPQTNLPLNPRGRIGVQGRGRLYLYGACGTLPALR